MIKDINITITPEKYILEYLESSCKSIAPSKLEKHIAGKFFLKKKQAKSIIKSLVDHGHLAYKDLHGRTIIEISYNRAVHVSKHIVLIPPDISYKPGSGDIVIRLLHGASFGTGQHPTTRLSLQAIDWLFSETGFAKNCRQESELLDIGTGSGVLAIAGIKMGITKGFGTDIDPCALSEAKVNARINNLERTLTFGNPDLEIFKDRFSLIIANLRFPTLKELCPRIISLTGTQGAIVLSGIKSDELPKLVKIYSKNNFTCSWQKLEKDWGAAVFLDIDKFLGNC